MSEALAVLECHKNLAAQHKELLEQAIRRVGSAYAIGMDSFQQTLRDHEREEQRRQLEMQLLLSVLAGCFAGGISWLGVLATETVTMRFAIYRYSGRGTDGIFSGVVRARDVTETLDDATRLIMESPVRAAQYNSLMAKLKSLEDALSEAGANLIQVGLQPEVWQPDTAPVSLNPQVFQNRIHNRFSHYWSQMLTLFQQAHVEIVRNGVAVNVQRLHARIRDWVAQFRRLSPETIAEDQMALAFEKGLWAKFILQHFSLAPIPRGPILRRLGTLNIFREAGADALWRQYSLAGPLHAVGSEHDKVRQWAGRYQPAPFGLEQQATAAPVHPDLVCPAPPMPAPPRRRAAGGTRR